MNEQDLIRKFNRLYDERHNLQGSIKWLQANNLNFVNEQDRLLTANKEITEIIEVLKAFAGNSTVNRYYNLIEQLRIVHHQLTRDGYGNYIDPNQNLILKGYLFSTISELMSHAVNSLGLDLSGFKYSGDEFDHQPLKDYIGKVIKQLENNDMLPKNYIELFDFVKRLQAEFWAFVEKAYADYI